MRILSLMLLIGWNELSKRNVSFQGKTKALQLLSQCQLWGPDRHLSQGKYFAKLSKRERVALLWHFKGIPYFVKVRQVFFNNNILKACTFDGLTHGIAYQSRVVKNVENQYDKLFYVLEYIVQQNDFWFAVSM